MNNAYSEYPKISDLPIDEQKPFRCWLAGQTIPVSKDGESCYYPWDYERWKKGQPILD
jgi:hypothetical protein